MSERRGAPLDRRVYESLSAPGGWLGPNGRTYTIRHFAASDGTRIGMRYHVLEDGGYPAVAWSKVEKLFAFEKLLADPDVREMLERGAK